MNRVRLKTALMAGCAGIVLFAGLGSSALAQTTTADQATTKASKASDASDTVVVVTGSRLASKGFKAPSPVTVLDSQELTLAGTQNVETTLQESPQFVGNLYNSAGNGQNMGVAALNLRGLGERRSLTLVNGRRWTVTGTSNLTDLNTIPAALVKRVEVVTGGSSAVYGSDAIAGVVNFIMRDDFQGVEVNAQTRMDEHTHTPESTLDLTVGGNFADGKGNAVVSLDYSDRQGIQRGQFAWSAVGLADGCVTPSTWSKDAAGTPLSVPSGQTCTSAGGRAGLVAANSSIIPGGRWTGVPLYGSSSSNPGLNAALLAAGLQNMGSFGFTFDPGSNSARAALDPADRFNNTPPNYMQTPLRRWMINSFAHYDINEHATAYLEAHYSDDLSITQIAPLALSGTVLVNTNNPYLSAADQQVLQQLDQAETGTTKVSAGIQNYTTTPGDGLAVLGINRRMLEGGSSTGTYERQTFRTAFGLRGPLTDNLRYDLYYSYARTQTTDSDSSVVSRSKFQAAILSVGGAAPVINPFGVNTITAAQYAAISEPSTNTTYNEQQVVAGNLTGSFFHLPAGTIDFNTGFEWRYNRLQVQPDALASTGDTADPNGVPTAITGSTTVKELYAEVRVPILKDLPFAQRLAINGAARYSDYNTAGVGGVWTDSLGLQWQPVDDVTVRIQKQRAIRAPGVDELYTPQTAGNPAATDPCSNKADSSLQTAAVKALCIATGVPAANVFTAVVQPNTQVGTLTGGNPNVGPETSDTTTFGVVYQPHQVRGLALSLDWYKITLDGAISTLGGSIQNVFNLCYYTLKDANSAYCKAIHRSPNGELTSNVFNDPYYVDQFVANTGGMKTSGIDFDGSYGFNIGYSPFGGRSHVDINTSWSYTSEYTLIPVQAMPNLIDECVGSYGATCGSPIPKWKGTTRITWQNGPLTLSLHDRYTGAVTRDTYIIPLRQGLTPPAKSDITAVDVPGIHYIDLSFELNLPGRTIISGGINNIFDKNPPLLGGGASTWGLNTAPGVYEIYGRTYFLGVKKSF